MSLNEWIREYRDYPVGEASRPLRRPASSAELPPHEADYEESAAPYVILPADRLRDRTPRWMRRAERVGYAPARSF
jgi:hypothetical protein